MKRKHSLYTYEQTSEVAHLLPLRNHTKLNSRYTKLNTPAEGGGFTENYHGTSFDKVNRSTEYETLKFKRISEANRMTLNQDGGESPVNAAKLGRQENQSRFSVENPLQQNSVEDYSSPGKQSQKWKTVISQSKTPAEQVQSSLNVSPSQRSDLLETNKGWYARMMRHSSRHWEQDPRFVQSLMRYNQVDHLHYNPTLESKAFRTAYKNTMNVSVPLIQQKYQKNKASIVNYELIEEETGLGAKKIHRASQDLNPDIIYDRFVKDLSKKKGKNDINEAQALNEKLQNMVQDFQHKIYRVPLFKVSKITIPKHDDDKKDELSSASIEESDKPKKLSKFQLLMQHRLQKKQQEEHDAILEAQRREAELLKEHEAHNNRHNHLSNKEIEMAVEELLENDRIKSTDGLHHRGSQSMMMVGDQSRTGITEDMRQRSTQVSNKDQGIRVSWQIKNQEGYGRKTAMDKKRAVQMKQRMIINDIRSGGNIRVMDYRQFQGIEEDLTQNQSSMFNYNRSTVGSSTGFKHAALSTNKRSRSIEFDEKQDAVSKIMQDCTERIDQKLSQQQFKEIEKLREINDSEMSLATIIGEYQERDRKKQSSGSTSVKAQRLDREVIGLYQYIKQQNVQNQCDAENFLSEAVIKRIKNDNLKLSGMVQLIKKVSKNSQNGRKKIWKPNPLILATGVAELS